MNIFQKICAFFGAEYVILFDCHTVGGEPSIRRAKTIDSHVYARRFHMLSETMCHLLPNGKIKSGPSYVEGWEPITRKSKELYHSSSYANAVKATDLIEGNLK